MKEENSEVFAGKDHLDAVKSGAPGAVAIFLLAFNPLVIALGQIAMKQM